jgi:hypothetical protein
MPRTANKKTEGVIKLTGKRKKYFSDAELKRKRKERKDGEAACYLEYYGGSASRPRKKKELWQADGRQATLTSGRFQRFTPPMKQLMQHYAIFATTL